MRFPFKIIIHYNYSNFIILSLIVSDFLSLISLIDLFVDLNLICIIFYFVDRSLSFRASENKIPILRGFNPFSPFDIIMIDFNYKCFWTYFYVCTSTFNNLGSCFVKGAMWRVSIENFRGILICPKIMPLRLTWSKKDLGCK